MDAVTNLYHVESLARDWPRSSVPAQTVREAHVLLGLMNAPK
jgi:hypothetical protein